MNPGLQLDCHVISRLRMSYRLLVIETSCDMEFHTDIGNINIDME